MDYGFVSFQSSFLFFSLNCVRHSLNLYQFNRHCTLIDLDFVSLAHILFILFS